MLIAVAIILGVALIATVFLLTQKTHDYEDIEKLYLDKIKDNDFMNEKLTTVSEENTRLKEENEALWKNKEAFESLIPFLSVKEEDRKDWYKSMYKDMIGTIESQITKS